jgi:hypothetical protein
VLRKQVISCCQTDVFNLFPPDFPYFNTTNDSPIIWNYEKNHFKSGMNARRAKNYSTARNILSFTAGHDNCDFFLFLLMHMASRSHTLLLRIDFS